MQCELFEYSEDFDTGVTNIDLVEDQQAYTIELTMDATGTGTYYANENVTMSISGTDTVVGEVVSWSGDNHKLVIKDNTRTLDVGDTLTGADNGAVYDILTITDVMTMSNDGNSQNKEFEDKDSSYLDFSETNPFGEP